MKLGFGIGMNTVQPAQGGAAPETEPFSFTLTAAEFSEIIVGYHPSFEVGSISREPLSPGADTALEFFYSRTDTEKTIIQFDGQHATFLQGYTLLIGGVPVVWEIDWTEAEAGEWKTAAQADGVLLAVGSNAITWEPI